MFLMLQLNIVGMCLLDVVFKTNFHGVLLGLAMCLKSSSLKRGFGGLESSDPGFLFLLPCHIALCCEGISGCQSLSLLSRSSLVLMLHFSPRGVQVPVSPAFSLFTSTQRY